MTHVFSSSQSVNSLRARSVVAALSSLALLMVAACGSPGSDSGASSEMTKIEVIKSTPSFGDLPLHIVAAVTGPANGLELSQQEFEGAVAGNAFAGGEGDFLVAGIDKPVLAANQKLFDPMIIGSIMNSNVWVAVSSVDSGIKTMADLRGKKIANSGPGGVSDAFIRWNLVNEGIDPDKDVELIGLGAADAQYAALQQGQVDVALLLSPLLEEALDTGKYQIIEGGDWRTVKFPALVVSTRKGDYEKAPETSKKFQAALADAMDMIANDREQATKIAADAFDLSEEKAAALIEAHLNIWRPELKGGLSSGEYDSAVEIMDTSGLITADKFPAFASVTPPSQ